MDNFDFDVEESSTQEAKEVEQTTGSKYEPLAEQWKTARMNDNAVILRGVEKNQVDNIRNYFYRAFEKEDVIVRSKAREQDDTYNVTIRARENGEYLQNEDTSEEDTSSVVEEAESTDMEESTSMDMSDDMQPAGESGDGSVTEDDYFG
jgi:hypothetical protein